MNRKAKKSKRSLSLYLLIVSLLLVFSVAGYVGYTFFVKPGDPQLRSIINLDDLNPVYRLKTQYGINREEYGTIPEMKVYSHKSHSYVTIAEHSAKDIFDELPGVPSNYGLLKRRQMEQGIVPYCDIGAEYFEQPEFTSPSKDLFMKNFDNYYKQYLPERVVDTGKSGFSQYDALHFYPRNGPSGVSSGVACGFVWSGYGVWKYMGAHLLVYPMPVGVQLLADGNCERVVSDDVVKYLGNGIRFNVSPENVLFGPTYPKFKSGINGGISWISRVVAEVKVDSSVPPGVYMVGVDLVSPNSELSREFSLKVLDMGEMYAEPNPLFKEEHCGVSVPPLMFKLVVY